MDARVVRSRSRVQSPAVATSVFVGGKERKVVREGRVEKVVREGRSDH